jgi:hypothetical protein
MCHILPVRTVGIPQHQRHKVGLKLSIRSRGRTQKKGLRTQEKAFLSCHDSSTLRSARQRAMPQMNGSESDATGVDLIDSGSLLIPSGAQYAIVWLGF